MSYVHHTILLLDDNPDDARFVRLALQRVGVITPVQTVSDSEQAQCYLGGQGCFADTENYPRPVLVLLDLIANKSGREFLAWLREQPLLKRLPVVVLTSSREEADINRAYELGCNSYLVKPVSFNTLLVMMQTLTQYWLGLNLTPQLGNASLEN
jgi:CheY-like chemotaxis protein